MSARAQAAPGRSPATATNGNLSGTGRAADTEPGRIARATLFLLPILGAAGPYLPGIALPGINLFPFRLAILASVILPILLHARIAWFRYSSVQVYLMVGAVWTMWGLMSAFWARNEAAALAGAMTIFGGFLVGLAFVSLRGHGTAGLKWLIRGWMAAGFLCICLAIWELATGNHLPGEWADSQPEHVTRFLAIATFHNPNNFAAFLLLLTSLVMYNLDNKKYFTKKLPAYIYLILIFMAIFVTGSRLSLFGFIILLFIEITMNSKDRLKLFVYTIISLIGFILIYQRFSDVLPGLDSITFLFERGISADGSGSSRLNLARAGLDMLASSNGLGIGAGNFQDLMAGGYKSLPTSNLVDPHNWWFEILSQYGSLVFFIYIGIFFYFSLVIFLSKKFNAKKSLMIFLFAFFVAAVANSSYAAQTTNWMFLATLLVFVLNAAETRRRSSNAGGDIVAPQPAASPA